MPGLAVKTQNRDGFSCLSKWDTVMHNCATCASKDMERDMYPCRKCNLHRDKWTKAKEVKKC